MEDLTVRSEIPVFDINIRLLVLPPFCLYPAILSTSTRTTISIRFNAHSYLHTLAKPLQISFQVNKTAALHQLLNCTCVANFDYQERVFNAIVGLLSLLL